MTNFDNGFDLIDRNEARVLQFLSKCVSPVEYVPMVDQYQIDVLLLKGFVSSHENQGKLVYALSSQGKSAIEHLQIA